MIGRRVPHLRPATALAIVLGATLATGCSTAKQKKLEAEYGPSESVIEVVAVLRRHVPDDTYRFPPATDFTGRNVYRSSLLRLESIERMHADALRSGYMDGVIAFSKARALERLRGFDLAAVHYREAARIDEALREEALHSAHVCEEIAEAVGVGIDFEDPVAKAVAPEPADGATAPLDPEAIVAALDERVALLSFLLDEEEETHYAAVIREEIERADQVRAAWFERHRYDLPDGQLRAVSERQRVASRHAASKYRLRHVLRLAALYDDLAHEYVNAVPPESLRFDPARFQDLVDPAVHLYESVAAQDGTPEKLEAARRLEAFLAFTLLVDRDRFTY
jgi:hypothetical protein